jgi:hypothetical protein
MVLAGGIAFTIALRRRLIDLIAQKKPRPLVGIPRIRTGLPRRMDGAT